MSVEEVFKYAPFENSAIEIRLLILLPGEEWSTIRCGLQTVALHCSETSKAYHSAPIYSALSYAWGQPQHNRSINLEGKVATVRETLWNALFYLRSSTESLTIWVDALCIDQENVEERNSQVARMGQIYGAAERVLVWLGLPSEESYAALRLLQSPEVLVSDNHLNTQAENREKEWRSVDDICLRPYWKRLWIIQEVIRAVNITVQCGTAVIGWNEFINGLETLLNRVSDNSKIEIIRTVLHLARHRGQYHQSGCGLLELLETFGNSVCFDPRDKVYGLLGLANDCGSGAITANYNKSTEEVFEDVVTFLYNQSLEQEISQANMNWRCPGIVRSTKLLRSLLFEGDIPDTKESDCAGNLFHFVGFFTATVALLGPILSSVRTSQQQRNNLLATWYYAVRPHSLAQRHQVYESMKSGLASVFELDIACVKRISLIESSTAYATIGPRAKEAINGAPSAEGSTNPRQEEQVESVRLVLVRRRQAFSICLVPCMAQTNDIVATFYDSDVVVILRPRGGAHCQVLGTAVLIPCIPSNSNVINQYGTVHVDIKTLQLLVR